MANQIEDLIRDKLVLNLSLLEEGLTFIDKEKYLPHSLGTKGFVDILARDAQGQLVLIELKRSNASCRQAVHEILKYIEAAKENFKANEDEIRVFVVSTEWAELLVPFSSFVKNVNCNVRGYSLQVDVEYNPISATIITPSRLNTDRLLSRRHAVNLYTSKENLEKGVSSHVAAMENRGIQDYVLLKLDAAPEHHERDVQSTYLSYLSLLESFGVEQPSMTIEQLGEGMQNFTHMLYFALQNMEVEDYLNILSREPKLRAEVDRYARIASDEEVLVYCEELVLYSLSPKIYIEHWDAGSPARFSKILDQEQWQLTSVLRFGAFDKNIFLPDETIIDELRGSQGITRQKYAKNFDSTNFARINRIKRDVKNCLVDNPIWRNHILQILDSINDLMDTEEFIGRVYIFNLNNILQSLYMLNDYDDGLMYVPTYSVDISFSNGKSMTYYGVLRPTKARPSLSSILDKYYEGDAGKMARTLIRGGYEERDSEVMMDIGLEPMTHVVEREEEDVTYFQFSDQRLLPISQVPPFEGIIQFIEENSEFVEAIASIFAEHHVGGMYIN